MAKLSPRILVVFFTGLLLGSCGEKQDDKAETLRLLTTTSTVGSGLFDVLIPAFEKKHAIPLR